MEKIDLLIAFTIVLYICLLINPIKSFVKNIKRDLTILILLISLGLLYLLNIQYIHEQFRKLNKKLKQE